MSIVVSRARRLGQVSQASGGLRTGTVSVKCSTGDAVGCTCHTAGDLGGVLEIGRGASVLGRLLQHLWVSLWYISLVLVVWPFVFSWMPSAACAVRGFLPEMHKKPEDYSISFLPSCWSFGHFDDACNVGARRLVGSKLLKRKRA